MQSYFRGRFGGGAKGLIGVIFGCGLISGCTGPALTDYAGQQPVLEPRTFFQGELTARGIVKDFSGEVIRTFDADITASWNAQGVGTLDEEFRFDDGEVQTRIWKLEPVETGYRATAGDVVEPGLMQWRGNALHMNYVLEVPYGDGTLDVRMDDWMYAVTPDTVVNETEMSKWGVTVGEIVLVIQRQTPDEQ
ncbi:DUF3833 domain-containing protein [Marinobacter fonticola]|uniref:DUF3833 domain-containing protein n=1 Tax=Marinobacter fonticola TaxID=2603215 RepID=UPI0011E7637D|nr:DUF3833 domain-containing protein [Marinobacter fonticola]